MARARACTQIALGLVALTRFGCIEGPSYEGKACDPSGGCPPGLFCDSNHTCVSHEPVDASARNDAAADASHLSGADADVGLPRDAGTSDSALEPDAAAAPDAAAGCAIGSVTSCYTGPEGTQAHAPCHTGQSTCMNGAWGPCLGEIVPSLEICNGVDDDCDGVVDNTCPTGQAAWAGTPVATPVVGGGAATVWMNVGCPAGQVAVGFHGNSGTYVDAVAEHCGIPTIVEDRSITPFSYTLEIAAGFEAPARGGTGGTPWDYRCAAGEIVIGVEGHDGTLIDQFTFTCSRFEVATGTTAAGGTTYRIVEIGPRHAQPTPVGGTGGSPFSADCPLGYTVSHLNGSDGPFILGMQTVTLVGSVGSSCTELAPLLRP